MNPTMRAWQYHAIDGKLEDHLSLNDNVPAPKADTLGKGQIIVEVISASLNPVDYKFPESGLMGRLMIPRPATPGLDFCGRVVARHASETTFEAGQLVFGGFKSAGQTPNGTLGQYIVISSDCCAPLPNGVDPDQAAAVGTAATTGYQSLMPSTLKPGANIFVNGGSGGVGTWTIQFAKALKAKVVTTCSTGNVGLCRDLGADEVIDYKKEDVVSHLKARTDKFDLVIDNVGSSSELFQVSSRLLAPGGTFVQVGVGGEMSMTSIASTIKRSIVSKLPGGTSYYFVNMNNNTEFLSHIGQWMAAGEAKAVIDSAYPYEDVPKAFAKLREGHVRGKIVIHVGETSSTSN